MGKEKVGVRAQMNLVEIVVAATAVTLRAGGQGIVGDQKHTLTMPHLLDLGRDGDHT